MHRGTETPLLSLTKVFQPFPCTRHKGSKREKYTMITSLVLCDKRNNQTWIINEVVMTGKTSQPTTEKDSHLCLETNMLQSIKNKAHSK